MMIDTLIELRPYLRRWGLRLKLVESLSWGTWGAVVGVGVGLLLALAARLWPLWMTAQLATMAGMAVLLGVTVGLAIVWLRPRPLLPLTRLFDRRLELAERLATAAEIKTGRLGVVPAMAEAQLADTLEAARQVDYHGLLPLRVSRQMLGILVFLSAALLFSLLWPNPQEAVLLHRASVREAIEEQIEELEALEKEIAEAKGLDAEEREKLLQALDETLSGLKEGDVTPEEALAVLAELEQELAALQDAEAAELESGLDQAAKDLADSALTEEMAEKLEEGDYQAAAEALSKYGDELDQLTPEERLELAQQLAEAAEELAEVDPELSQQLAEAAEALEMGDIERADEALKAAAGELGEAGERVERQDAVEGMLAELQEGREKIAGAIGEDGQGQGDGDLLAGPGQQEQPGHSEDAGSGDPYDDAYDPGRIDEDGVGVDVGREGGDGVPIGNIAVPVPEGGDSDVPYEQVYTEYAEDAGAALEGSYIPLGMKQYIRDYFSSLEP
jgi:hypothetical protein